VTFENHMRTPIRENFQLVVRHPPILQGWSQNLISKSISPPYFHLPMCLAQILCPDTLHLRTVTLHFLWIGGDSGDEDNDGVTNSVTFLNKGGHISVQSRYLTLNLPLSFLDGRFKVQLVTFSDIRRMPSPETVWNKFGIFPWLMIT